MNFGVIVHGGAWDIPDEAVLDHLKGVEEASRIAYEILRNGGRAVDAVEACVTAMEDESTFDAGSGSFVNKIGEVEMDAIIATDDLRIGAVCAVQNIKNPIKLARLVMERTNNVLLAGKGANIFAREQGIPEYKPEDLLVGRELERYNVIKEIKDFEPKNSFRASRSRFNRMGTVGSVCLDKFGSLAIGVSTGGTPFKRAGRVGDSPLWGSGGYVEKTGGAAATGFGEDLIRILATRQTIDYLRIGFSAQQAVNKTIRDLEEKVNGVGGIIVLTPDDVGLSFNTPRMAFSYRVDDDEAVVGINPEDLQTRTR